MVTRARLNSGINIDRDLFGDAETSQAYCTCGWEGTAGHYNLAATELVHHRRQHEKAAT